MESLIIVVHVLAAIGITGLVLIQHGKGADMGASFGSGASQTIFGSVGSGNALTKSTSWLATVFFATSLVLALFAKQQAGQSITDDGLIQNTGVLTETPAPLQDLPVVESVTPGSDDLPQAAAQEAAPVEAEAAAETEVETDQEAAAEETDAADAAETPAQ
ncbi:MAG: preprotein translocase subunit SecG [Pseudomonadota bacterium]|nr:preprotein translocase subunit SecG [Pseudomonadota bacterium]